MTSISVESLSWSVGTTVIIENISFSLEEGDKLGVIGVNGSGKVTVNSGNYSAKTIATDANAAQATWVAYVMSSGGTPRRRSWHLNDLRRKRSKLPVFLLVIFCSVLRIAD